MNKTAVEAIAYHSQDSIPGTQTKLQRSIYPMEEKEEGLAWWADGATDHPGVPGTLKSLALLGVTPLGPHSVFLHWHSHMVCQFASPCAHCH